MADDMDAQTVLRALGRGRDHALPIGKYQERLGWSRRRVEKALRALRLEGWPVGSSGNGVWLADLPEFEQTIASLHRRLVSQIKTLRTMREKRDKLRAENYKQTTLFGEAA